METKVAIYHDDSKKILLFRYILRLHKKIIMNFKGNHYLNKIIQHQDALFNQCYTNQILPRC